jgi:hypothetical protein
MALSSDPVIALPEANSRKLFYQQLKFIDKLLIIFLFVLILLGAST